MSVQHSEKQSASQAVKQKAAAVKVRKGESAGMQMFKRLITDKTAIVAFCILLALTIVAILAPYISPYSYSKIDGKSICATPSLAHPFGCDELGRDILSRLMYGGRFSLSVGILSVAFSAVFGIIIGAISGFFGGWVDNIIMRILDIVQSIPNMLMAMLIAAVMGSGFINTVVAIGVSGIPNIARMMRANILSIREREYVEAAISINCRNARIIAKHVVPNAISPVLIAIMLGIGGNILVAASLSFIGLGVQPPTPEWGAMLSDARQYIRDYPHMVLFPGLVIMVAVLSFNLFGDALRDALDPKLKK